ncbi:MAG: ferrous iron transport protein B [Bacteroidales bacterium]|nr:ferrous iron transport protein B [Bacteroidales bacterium]
MANLRGRKLLVLVVGMPDSNHTALLEQIYKKTDLTDEPDAVIFNGQTIRFVDIQDVNVAADPHVTARRVAGFVKNHKPDLILNVVDSTNLEESLHLTAHLIDMHSRLVVALNKYDDLLATDHSVDYEQLGNMMGFKATPTDSSSGKGINELLNVIIGAIVKNEGVKHTHVPYGQDLERSIGKIEEVVLSFPDLRDYDKRYVAIRLLQDFENCREFLNGHDKEIEAVVSNEAKVLRREFHISPAELLKSASYGFVHGALQETLRHSKDDSDHTFLQKLDAVLTNRWLGLPLLLLVLFLVFEATFTLGAYPQDWIDSGVNFVADWLRGIMPHGWFSSMVIDGVVMGVGAVLAFLPNIIILFFFLSMLEDSGYMSRAAFVMDKIMHPIGLHGRSFIPMLIGFGCNVPAILAAKSIDNKKDRTLTMLMIPFMSCSARLPVYMLFVAAFFAKYKSLVMMSMYVIGIVFAIIFAFIMKRTKCFRQSENDYVSELPPFRKPTLRNTGAHIWERTSDYLKKISTVILAASVVIWALEYFPNDKTDNGANKEESYLAMIGRSMEPVMRPLGFDWKMNVCILTGLPAKEAIVSTMGILYHIDEEEGTASLAKAMRDDVYTSGPRIGQHVFTPAVSWAFMLFVLLYFPCIATIATLRREIGRGWAAFTVVNSLLLAWIVAFGVYQIFG